MKFGTQDQDFFPKNVLEKFKYVKALGFDSFEINGRLLLEAFDEVQEASQITGLKIDTVCGGYQGHIGDFNEANRQNAIQAIKEILEAIAKLEGKGIVVPAGWGLHQFRDQRNEEENFAILSDSLKQLNDFAVETRTFIYLEPLNRYEDHLLNRLEQAGQLIEKNQFEHVKIMADFFHMNIEEDSIVEALQKNKSLIGHIHLADNQRFQPGSGFLAFNDYFKTLNEIDYDDSLVYECRVKGENLDHAYQQSLEYLKGLV